MLFETGTIERLTRNTELRTGTMLFKIGTMLFQTGTIELGTQTIALQTKAIALQIETITLAIGIMPFETRAIVFQAEPSPLKHCTLLARLGLDTLQTRNLPLETWQHNTQDPRLRSNAPDASLKN